MHNLFVCLHLHQVWEGAGVLWNFELQVLDVQPNEA